jgi:hypothetical protein
MADDILRGYPVEQVQRWYNRLADAALAKRIKGQLPLSGQFLKAFVNPRKKKATSYRFTAPVYLQTHSKVTEALFFHRRVFLTEEKARLGEGGKTHKWAGLLPRLRDNSWDGVSLISLYYQSLVDVAPTYAAIVRVQISGTEEEKDLFTSLRGFHLRSGIEVKGFKKGKFISIQFKNWEARALDRYDFKYDEHLTLPNPDHQSKDNDAIRPDLKSFRVYHINAKRMVDKGLAAPFDLEVGPWKVTNSRVTAEGDIDPAKPL